MLRAFQTLVTAWPGLASWLSVIAIVFTIRSSSRSACKIHNLSVSPFGTDQFPQPSPFISLSSRAPPCLLSYIYIYISIYLSISTRSPTFTCSWTHLLFSLHTPQPPRQTGASKCRPCCSQFLNPKLLFNPPQPLLPVLQFPPPHLTKCAAPTRWLKSPSPSHTLPPLTASARQRRANECTPANFLDATKSSPVQSTAAAMS